ncbi:DegQ family serine endoprotease [Aquabacterium sp.]|uniref:DegQ family serine endoprotease n=1 Tax=Aquabacterium sp. TaxID=1872578 RepID=UPI002486DD95|nr:DegQ family serine endoprotease [Aquabacterium sp.]MDI1349456.1 DegQ family serine endoprotease [Aquabacterium sp.]
MSSPVTAASTPSVIRRTLVVGAVVSAVGLVLSSSLFPHASQAQQPAAALLAPASPPPANAAAPVIVKGLPDFTELVEKVGPSVVSIRTTQRVAEEGGDGDEADAQMREFFKRFFGVPMPDQRRGTPGAPNNTPNTPKRGAEQGEERPRGVGSGFILSPDGYVMTNAHVVDGADEVYVNLTDKREFKAKVVGADKRTDVAVLKIDAKQLPAVAVGEVSRVKVGEWVMAIGTPFGLENTVTAGIVSAKARDTGEEIRFIQTDVAVNPGNSGGPLINMRGEVVGINSQILSRSGGFMGISLSIPIDDAMKVADQLRSGGKVVRGRIGVSIAPVSKDVAESIGLGKAQGALVQAVEPGTPADKAGVEAGDIITKFNGQTIDKAPDLPRLVAATKPGTKSTLQVFRRGAYKELTVTVGEMDSPKAKAEAGKEEAAPRMASAAALGLSVSDLSADQKRELRQNGGVLVSEVQGPAARAGLRAGDIILSVANVQIGSAKEFEAVLAKLEKGRAVNVLVRRGEWAQYAVIRPGK